jgi:hypothetical protein
MDFLSQSKEKFKDLLGFVILWLVNWGLHFVPGGIQS